MCNKWSWVQIRFQTKGKLFPQKYSTKIIPLIFFITFITFFSIFKRQRWHKFIIWILKSDEIRPKKDCIQFHSHKSIREKVGERVLFRPPIRASRGNSRRICQKVVERVLFRPPIRPGRGNSRRICQKVGERVLFRPPIRAGRGDDGWEE